MRIIYHSGVYTLETEQILKAKADLIWHFFSNPTNLEKLSPAEIFFKVTSPEQTETYPGQIITYKIKPFPFIRFNWVTEITRVHNGSYFIDEQRFGPYLMWHHEHFFEPVQQGVRMRDKVTLKMPYGLLGRIAFNLFVRKKLKAIFSYRAKMADVIFSK